LCSRITPEVGAGTFNPATFLRCLDARPWRAAYVEPSIRPTDGRYGDNPYRLGHFYQYQVVIKPSPANIQDIYLQSLVALGVKLEEHDVRFVEDNWEGPTLVLGDLAGRSGSTAWRRPNSLTSSNSVESIAIL